MDIKFALVFIGLIAGSLVGYAVLALLPGWAIHSFWDNILVPAMAVKPITFFSAWLAGFACLVMLMMLVILFVNLYVGKKGREEAGE